MKKFLLITLLSLAFVAAKAQTIVTDPTNLAFQIDRWITQKSEMIKQHAQLVAIAKTLKQGVDLYQKVDGVLRQSVYIKDCFKIQMDATDLAINYLQYDPKQIAKASLYHSYGETIMYNVAQIDELGKLINTVLMPTTKLTTADRMKELRAINEDMRKRKKEIITKCLEFEEINNNEILRNKLVKKIR